MLPFSKRRHLDGKIVITVHAVYRKYVYHPQWRVVTLRLQHCKLSVMFMTVTQSVITCKWSQLLSADSPITFITQTNKTCCTQEVKSFIMRLILTHLQ